MAEEKEDAGISPCVKRRYAHARPDGAKKQEFLRPMLSGNIKDKSKALLRPQPSKLMDAKSGKKIKKIYNITLHHIPAFADWRYNNANLSWPL
ncbi:MAG: hypothetical protein ABW189_00435 [Rickettsiales bacterium]